MKRRLLTLMAVLCALTLCAQEGTESDAQQPVQQPKQEVAAPSHILFEGVEMKGDIYDFSKALQKAGFQLQKRDANARQYIFKGDVCGRPTQFQVSFTKRTKTVFRIMAQIKSMPIDELMAALNERYGEPYDVADRQCMWQLPGGAVMLGTPTGYDPTLVVMDATGVEAYKEEDAR